MIALQTSLYLVAVALCAFCTGLVTRRKPMTYFTGFLVIQSAIFLFELLIAHPSSPLKALWLGLLMSGSLLLAPCLWLAFQESIAGARPRLRDLPRSHLFAIIAGFVLTLPLILSAHLGTTFDNPQREMSWLHTRFIHTTMLLCIAIFVVQVPWYLARCRRIVMDRMAGRAGHWAELPAAIVFTTWVLAIVRTLNVAFIKWPSWFSLVVAVISVSITVGALYLLLRKFGLDENRAGDKEPASYAKSPLGEAQRLRIRRKLEDCLSRNAIYKRSDLTLRSLSETLNESPHYVSQVLSQDLDTNFYELVNRHRIAEAKRMLRESPEQTVLAIAMDVGFNSKSAFHTAFRRCTGITPSEFRESRLT